MDPLFLSPLERKHRVEALMKIKGLSWYRLAQLMGSTPTGVQQAFCWDKGDEPGRDITLNTLIKCARTLGVSAGFLIDREEEDIEPDESDNQTG